MDEAADQPGVESASPAAAATFAEQLRANGIKVVGQPSVASAAGGEQVAAIDSLPVSLLVQELLVHSNNFIAEMLLRQLALADDRPASFDGGTSADGPAHHTGAVDRRPADRRWLRAVDEQPADHR